MRNSVVLLLCLAFAACGGSNKNAASNIGPNSCSNNDQKRYVLEVMQDWYLWNDRLPSTISVADYASPAELLAYLVSFSPADSLGQPRDRFSYLGSAAADSAFFGGGQYLGFGFSSKLLAADDLRLTQVFENSPAESGGLERGQRILEINGRSIDEIEAAEGISAALSVSPRTLLMETPAGTQFTVTLEAALVTINPVPQHRIIAANDGSGRMIGYLELSTFISTANSLLNSVFEEFIANGVNDVVLDLRYNGGGLVSTANLLGDFLGGDIAEGEVFSRTLFNADRAAEFNLTELFERYPSSMSLSRLVVVASERTASASELVTNSMAPWVEVTIVGDATYGKPVGQAGFEFCTQILRPIAFQTVNADGDGDYFNGLPVNCAAADDLSIPVGADADPNLVAALEFLATGACPVNTPATAAAVHNAARLQQAAPAESAAPPWREYAGAY